MRRTPLLRRFGIRNTGPSRSARDVVHARSGGVCEFDWCSIRAAQLHHRLPRRMGGTRRAAVNCPSNLVDLCVLHHEWIERNRARAAELGLLLPMKATPGEVPVLLRHSSNPVLLLPSGGWVIAP